MDVQTDILIVGAGGGGAILGLALGTLGIKTIVLEQAGGPPQGLRGEILQPNGQQILADMGLLDDLPQEAVRPVRYFHFRQVGGERLCTIDYDMLPSPYNRALVTLPNTVHHTVLQKLESQNPEGLWYHTHFTQLLYEKRKVVGVEACRAEKVLRIGAKLVVGADGPFSKVREALHIPTQLHRYAESYLIAILDCPEKLSESQYFVGKNEILGIFPAACDQVYVFSMIPSGAMAAIQEAGIQALRNQWTKIYPELGQTFAQLTDWKQTAYMGTGRARAKTWVADGAVLLGDAAHGMNPHASQGRMQAMVDAVTLAKMLPSCLENNDFSSTSLKRFENQRRPQVEMLQQLADEEVFFWNTGNPVLTFLRNRVFSTLDRNRRLQYQVLTATAGFRQTPPFGWLDRLQAAGILPDPRANQLPQHMTSGVSS